MDNYPPTNSPRDNSPGQFPPLPIAPGQLLFVATTKIDESTLYFLILLFFQKNVNYGKKYGKGFF